MLCFISSKNLTKVELPSGCGVPGLELEPLGGDRAADSSQARALCPRSALTVVPLKPLL